MIKTKRLLLIVLSALLIFAGQGLMFQDKIFGSNGVEETLTIKGNGVAKEITFSRSELEKMSGAIVSHEYSSTNNFPTHKTFYRKGVLLHKLLEQAGIMDSAKQLKFISTDGYTKVFTREELLNQERYSFKEDDSKVNVPVIVAFADSSKDLKSLEAIELSLTLGQRVKGEQNNPWFVKYLETIEVINEEPDQWVPVSFAKAPGPDGVTVKLNHPNMDSVKIYYTLDGTRPTIESKVYNVSATYYQPQLNKPILMTKDGEIRAIAIGPGKIESSVSTTSVMFGDSIFYDLEDYSWAKTAIESLAERKILSGMGGGRFAPSQTLTRAQFATMMVLAMNETPYKSTGSQNVSSGFSDVKISDWHFGYVKKAAEKGWIKGYTDGSFKPERTLSIEEMLTIAVSAVNKGDISKAEADAILQKFSSKSKISDWAKGFVATASQMGIIEYGHIITESAEGPVLNAQKQASRAEAAVTVYRLINE